MRLLADKHIQYIQSLDQNRDSLAYHLTEHLRINGVYWGLTSTLLLDRPGGLPRREMIDWVMSCWEPDSGGFRPHPGHDPHIHSTLSAIQILTMQDSLHVIDKPKSHILISYESSRAAEQDLFPPFLPNSRRYHFVIRCRERFILRRCWGETDARFSYCAVAGLALLGGLDKLDRDAMSNFDGGFGMVEGAESHAAMLDIVDANTLGWWLSERQVPNGGLNGRPEKLEDVSHVFTYVRRKQ
ncbi:hypothetical protein PSHT_02075 [Puccinia striiformis]|uniref:Geranylgeranyl transferase type-2 subunit beta n=1 Tax=Puccinia striiformis TaxID=27350 RepID=A0A2S4WJ79_9BASI|nr:hypothetical protein PSHT_02075 [Puccinia striiformis]